MKVGMLGLSMSVLVLSSCGPKDTTPAAPPVGWHQEEGWRFACYHPPDYAQLNEMSRRQARADVLAEMRRQWAGERDDGVSLGEDETTEIETVLLGRPEKIEAISQENLTQCKQVAANGASQDAWMSWIASLPGKLTDGECLRPLDFTMFDYLDIGVGWQRALSICQGDRIRISGTDKDRYRISDKDPWINVAGDTSQPTVGGEWPCTLQGCFAGQLILRFVSESGVENIYPVGSELIFTAPEHGEISYRINDATFYDNVWYQKGSMTDHTAIEISPAE